MHFGTKSLDCGRLRVFAAGKHSSHFIFIDLEKRLALTVTGGVAPPAPYSEASH